VKPPQAGYTRILRALGDIFHRGRVAPQPVEIIVEARLLGENVDDHIAVVHQDPFGIVVAFHRNGQLPAQFHEAGYLITDGLILALVGSAANDEIVRKAGEGAQVKHLDGGGFLGLGRADTFQPGLWRRRLLSWFLAGGADGRGGSFFGGGFLFKNTRKTDSLRRLEDRVFLPVWCRASAAFALLRTTRKTDSLRRLEDRVFLPVWRRASAAFALLRTTRKTELPSAALARCFWPVWGRGRRPLRFKETQHVVALP